MDAAAFLGSLDFVNLVLLFWYSVLLEAPRYMIGAVAAAQGGLAPVESETALGVIRSAPPSRTGVNAPVVVWRCRHRLRPHPPRAAL